jgi:hypothetical protein
METKRLMRFAILFLILSIPLACNYSDKKLTGGWVIDKAYYFDKPVVYNLFTNSFELYKDHTCFLPISEITQRNSDYEKGTWNSYEIHDTLYLKITSVNKIFNRVFKVDNYRLIDDPVSTGILTKATLSSDSLKFECTKAPI